MQCVGAEKMDALLKQSQFIGAMNGGNLKNVGSIWENIALRLKELGIPKKKVILSWIWQSSNDVHAQIGLSY